jgi:hypothetical protein
MPAETVGIRDQWINRLQAFDPHAATRRPSGLEPGGLAKLDLPKPFMNHGFGLDPLVFLHRLCRRFCSGDCTIVVAIRTTILNKTSHQGISSAKQTLNEAAAAPDAYACG